MEDLTLQITKTAEAKFMQFGLRSVSIDDICNELRISKKTFYQIFPKKEDLIKAVLIYQSKDVLGKFYKMHEERNAIDTLILMIKEAKNYTNYIPSPFYYDLEKYYPTLFTQYQERKSERIRENFEQNLHRGIAEGYYREDMDVELISRFHALQLTASYKELLADFPKKSKKQIIGFYIDLIVRLITNENGLKYVEEEIKKN